LENCGCSNGEQIYNLRGVSNDSNGDYVVAYTTYNKIFFSSTNVGLVLPGNQVESIFIDAINNEFHVLVQNDYNNIELQTYSLDGQRSGNTSLVNQYFTSSVLTKINDQTLSYVVQTLSQAVAVVYNISSQQNISVTTLQRYIAAFGYGNVVPLGISNQNSPFVSGFAYFNFNGSVCLTNILEQTSCVKGNVGGQGPNYDSMTNGFKVAYGVGQDEINYYEVTDWGLNMMNTSIVNN
jgi:hypothetical protein